MSFYGLDEFREKLAMKGFKAYPDSLHSPESGCNWIACLRIEAMALCETNDEKLQIVIKPYVMEHNGRWESAQASITGCQSGIWFKLEAYSMKPAEYLERMSSVNSMLLSAWNNLGEKP